MNPRHAIPALALGILAALGPMRLLAADAAGDTPAGRWKTVDDKTGRDRSIVRIQIDGGVLTGKVEQSLDPSDKPDDRCTKCTDSRKNQPKLGMVFLTGMHADKDAHHWSGGEILDPDNGQVYRAKLTVAPDGKTMEVRGFIGISLIGRSQTWTRVAP